MEASASSDLDFQVEDVPPELLRIPRNQSRGCDRKCSGAVLSGTSFCWMGIQLVWYKDKEGNMTRDLDDFISGVYGAHHGQGYASKMSFNAAYKKHALFYWIVWDWALVTLIGSIVNIRIT